jgi:hypothetical protein
MVNGGERQLSEKVALVAGATRGAGRAIAVELGRAGAHVYATGRSSRLAGRSEIDRPETIEETGELVEAAGGRRLRWSSTMRTRRRCCSSAHRVDQGRLRRPVNDMFGGDRYAQWTSRRGHDHPVGWDAPHERHASDHRPSRAAADAETASEESARTCGEMTDGRSVQRQLP